MGRIYTNSHKIKFTSISEKYQVDKTCKGKLSELHAMLITYVVSHFKDTKKYKQQVVDALNLITYAVYSGDILPFDWKPSNPFLNMPEFDEDLIQETLGDVYLTIDAIDWDVSVTAGFDDTYLYSNKGNKPNIAKNSESDKKSTSRKTSVKSSKSVSTKSQSFSPTPKQDLYIQSPVVPRFDYNDKWMQGHEGCDDLVIYTTLPRIPTRQNEISCTTDVTKMTYSELMNLYPNTVIHTRAPLMYEHIENLDYEDDIGVLLPIEGYTREQLIDNIIQYPHFYKLARQIDDQLYSFYTHIEIDGKLVSVLDVWNDLSDTKRIPRQKEFVKEYVVRKYLLDLTVKGVKYNYPLFGSLDPFLTLFMPYNKYVERGYTDTESLARQCVVSRVKYKLSRNPIVRRLDNAKLYI